TGAERLRTELAWREFYATVLADDPGSARHDLRPEMASMRHDTGAAADRRFEAWVAGRTGYPMVDAGMRQLAAEAWVHNRVRMIVASFLVKDLHLPWWRGARLFLARLQDGDLASNNHGWQWVAGTGTDPAPYFRVFNPVTQGEKFDPGGEYIRRWVPELAELPAEEIHTPWARPGGPPRGYPAPIVDHAAERREALARYEATKR
ncbi:MAG: deoxyribodipyrimidine photo-lyase, partial [Acidimicrobiia bacterium]|nr:deoxyribodipyrimidine photo-lyase [Acidimicrobiia bacterium]